MSENSFTNAAKQQISLKKKESNGTNAAPSLSNSDLLSSLGSSKAMPAGIREKMEGSFGMSLSDVKLFESPVVAENGAQAAASGKNIAFAPGKLDFTSASGQTLLGHELSHVASQARGEVTGHGYLKNPSLEHRADIEGAAAAAGETLYSAGGLRPMSTDTGLSAGPMQAKESKDERKRAQAEVDDAADTLMPMQERNAREGNKLGTSLREALDSANPEEKVELLRQLVQGNDYHALTQDEEAILDSEMEKFTPEMLKMLMDQKFAYSKTYMNQKRELIKENAGKGNTNKGKGKVASQAEADDALATMYTNYSDVGERMMSYGSTLRLAVASNYKLAGSDKKYASELLSRNDSDYRAAGKSFGQTADDLGYALGENGMQKAYDLQINQNDRNKYWQRPWLQQQKKKSWWHFW